MTDKTRDTNLLDAHFKALQGSAKGPDDALLARVIADADAVQTNHAASKVSGKPSEAATGPIMRFLALIGGWPAAAGLATAGVAGLWIGVSDPGGVMQSSQSLLFGGTTAALTLESDPALAFFDLDGGL